MDIMVSPQDRENDLTTARGNAVDEKSNTKMVDPYGQREMQVGHLICILSSYNIIKYI